MSEKPKSNRGRPPLGSAKQPPYEKFGVSMPPDLYQRLQRYCDDEEREKSWCIKKALDPWLREKGY